MTYILSSLSSFKFFWLTNKMIFFSQMCVTAVHGHPRSLISVPIESAYATSYWSIIVTLVISCTVSEIAGFLCSWPYPYFTLILGVFPLHLITRVWVRPSISLNLFGHEIIFEVFQPVPERHRQTDGRTDK